MHANKITPPPAHILYTQIQLYFMKTAVYIFIKKGLLVRHKTKVQLPLKGPKKIPPQDNFPDSPLPMLNGCSLC